MTGPEGAPPTAGCLPPEPLRIRSTNRTRPMKVRRLSRAAAGSMAAIALGRLTACGTGTHSTSEVVSTTAFTSSVKTAPACALCTALASDAAKRHITDARPTAQVGPDKGEAPDVCGYAAADGRSMLSLTPASRAYAAEVSAAPAPSADPASAGMRDVRVEPVHNLGQRAFRETAHQTQAQQHLTFVVWKSGARTRVLPFSTTATGASEDKVVQVARSITAKLPVGQ